MPPVEMILIVCMFTLASCLCPMIAIALVGYFLAQLLKKKPIKKSSWLAHMLQYLQQPDGELSPEAARLNHEIARKILMALPARVKVLKVDESLAVSRSTGEKEWDIETIRRYITYLKSKNL